MLALPPKARADGSLQSFALLNTGPYLANSNVHELSWTNSSGRALAIHKVYLWTGVDRGGIADVHIEARRGSDGSYIAIQQWDHYADPTVPQHGEQFDYASPMMIDPGETDHDHAFRQWSCAPFSCSSCVDLVGQVTALPDKASVCSSCAQNGWGSSRGRSFFRFHQIESSR